MAVFIIKRSMIARPRFWLTYCDHRHITVSHSGWSAMLDAIKAAHCAGLHEGAACVIVEDRNGNRELRWTFGQDHYPYGQVPTG